MFSHLIIRILYDASFVAAYFALFFFSYTHISRRDSFFFLFYRDLSLSFYTNYLGIVIFRFFCAFFSSRGASRLRILPSTCNLQAKKKYDSFIQIVEMINAKKLSFIAQFRRARFCVQREKNIILKGFSTILVMQYLCP